MGFDGSAIDGILNGLDVHGVVAMVVDRDGVLYEGAAGDAGLDTVFRNASMTKAVASTAALQLVEQGKLDLDATVESILPEFGELQVLDGFDGDTPLLRAQTAKPTIRQLMTHTAGMGYFFLNKDLLRYCETQAFPNPLSGEKRSLMAPLVHDPGTMWEYGVNTDWLGLVVEKLSGQSLGEYLAEHIYGPLGMTDSSFAPTDAQRARLLPIKFRMPDGTLADTELDLPAESEWDAAGHGSYGTATDYTRFIQAWLNDGGDILGADTVNLALRNDIEGVGMPTMLEPAMPELANPVPVLDVPQGWGLGFHLYLIDLPGMRSAGSGDWSGLFNTFFWIDRTAGIGAVFMTQVLPFFDMKVIEAALAFEAAVYAQVGAATTA